MQELDLLILGAGWSSTFLIPLLQERRLTFAATTRDGRDVAGASTIKWTFDPDEKQEEDATDTNGHNKHNQFSSLPLAKTILITFPLTGPNQSHTLVTGYRHAHANKLSSASSYPHFIQFGSTGIWQIEQRTLWVSRRSPYNTTNARAVAEDELLGLGGCVLNLAGLWGGERDPATWVDRVAKSREDVKSKKSLHMIHGMDVARAVLAIAALKEDEGGEDGWEAKGKAQRWMLTDGFVYDWWALFAGWADTATASSTSTSSNESGDGKTDRQPSQQAQCCLLYTSPSPRD